VPGNQLAREIEEHDERVEWDIATYMPVRLQPYLSTGLSVGRCGGPA
jgi:hypothetical protein